MPKGKCRMGPGKSVMGLLLVLVLAGLLVAVAACEDATPATSTSAAAVEETPTTESAPATTEQTTATTVTETTAVTEAPVSEAKVINLDNSDNGHEVVLQVGEHLRIDLAPKALDRVQAVEWDYEPIVVQEVDSGVDKADDAVAGAWLEVAGVVAGPVTIRASYEYPQGTVKTTYTVYVKVVGKAATGAEADVSVDEGEDGRTVTLAVGETLRVDLAPKVSDRVAKVEWDYEQVVVKEKDAGTNVINGVVVGAWLELEAVAAGPVTLRVHYEYPGGTVVTPWHLFVVVTD